MKKFLLTWYGITDFRASLGFEGSEGPILAALKADSYTHVLILGYTRADNDSDTCLATQKDFQTELRALHEAGQLGDRQATNAFVTQFANTTAAHDHFIGWLTAQAGKASEPDINFCDEKLRRVNDSEGIYASATQALNTVEKTPGENLVTLYLSPGTPVMAFVWALAALEHPTLKKRLIASSVPGRPPELVTLPIEWMNRHGVKPPAGQETGDSFDVTFHLFGEQRMPALLGIRQFASDAHVFVNSRQYPAACMRQFLGRSKFEELPVSPWDDRTVHEQITRYAAKLPSSARLGINLTGGTKLMFAGALSAARALGAVPFYFDSRNNQVTFIDNPRRDRIKPIDSIETFLLLNGDGLKIAGSGAADMLTPDRRRLNEVLWKHRSVLAQRYKELARINDEHRKQRLANQPLSPFSERCGVLTFRFDARQAASITGDGVDLRIAHWPDFAAYLSGGWFEEYVYQRCEPYQREGIIHDLRINVRLQMNHVSGGGRSPQQTEYNELDVVFTDGHSLYIVECKAGNVTQEQVMKLQNLVRFYGGVEGRGIMACCFPPRANAVKRKIDDAHLTLCCDDTFDARLAALMKDIKKRAATGGAA